MIIAATMNVFPRGKGNFGHVLLVDLQKQNKGHRLIIAGIFEVNWGNS